VLKGAGVGFGVSSFGSSSMTQNIKFSSDLTPRKSARGISFA
jgi:hypothetical protein